MRGGIMPGISQYVDTRNSFNPDEKSEVPLCYFYERRKTTIRTSPEFLFVTQNLTSNWKIINPGIL